MHDYLGQSPSKSLTTPVGCSLCLVRRGHSERQKVCGCGRLHSLRTRHSSSSDMKKDPKMFLCVSEVWLDFTSFQSGKPASINQLFLELLGRGHHDRSYTAIIGPVQGHALMHFGWKSYHRPGQSSPAFHSVAGRPFTVMIMVDSPDDH